VTFSHTLGTARNPTAEKTKHDSCNRQNDEYEKNRLLLVEINQLTHPSNHLSEKFADLRKQRANNGSRRSLKSSPFQKKYFGTCHGRNRRTNIEKTAAKIIK